MLVSRIYSPANDIILNDEQGLQGLPIIEGSSIMTLDNLPPGAKQVRRVTVVPESERIIPLSRAMIEYTSVDEDDHDDGVQEKEKNKRKKGYSSAVGPIEILDWDTYRIKTGNYNKEWTTFGIGASFPILLPMFVW